MNRLPTHRRTKILHMLVEGMSMRSVARVEDVSYNTVAKLLIDAGDACFDYHHRRVRRLRLRRIECDEVWCYIYARQKNVARASNAPPEAGDAWLSTALDPDSKLLVSWLVGERSAQFAKCFVRDLCSRVGGRFQITSDNCAAYPEAVEETCKHRVDFAQVLKSYGEHPAINRQHSKEAVVGQRVSVLCGTPDRPGTPYVERHNLTIRQSMRRYTRKTNGFSKKLIYHNAMVSLFMLYYNFCRIRQSLSVTPAMEAGLSRKLRDTAWIVELTNRRASKPGPRGPYKKKNRLTSRKDTL